MFRSPNPAYFECVAELYVSTAEPLGLLPQCFERHVSLREKRAALTALGAEVPIPVDPVPDPLTLASELPRRATLHTERGDIEIELFTDASPTTTQRFIQLAREDFFDGLTFR